MSSRTDCVYGYGFIVYASDEELKRFIEKHRQTVAFLDRGEELLEYMDRCSPEEFNPKEDFYDWECETSGNEGFYGVIADVMHKETGITFEYRRAGEDDDDAILLPELMPWQMNVVEKNLSQEIMDSVLQRYIDELGGQLKADHIRLEYFG